MLRSRSILVSLGLLSSSLLLAIASAAAPIVAVSNLGESLDGGVVVAGATRLTASSFTTGGDASQLDSIDLAMASAPAFAGYTAEVFLYDHGANEPGSVVESLGIITSGGATNEVLTASSSGTLLAPNTTYWVVVGHADGAPVEFTWTVTGSDSETSPLSWTIGDTGRTSTSDGSTWAVIGGSNVGRFAIQIVPEPSTAVLLGAGLAALGRRRRSAASGRRAG